MLNWCRSFVFGSVGSDSVVFEKRGVLGLGLRVGRGCCGCEGEEVYGVG